jgi:hypothetical protein
VTLQLLIFGTKITKWHINNNESTHITVTRSSNPIVTTYHMNGEIVPKVTHVNILGVTVTSDLKQNLHTDTVCCKANRILDMLSRSLKKCTEKNSKLLFISLVRSVLTFGTPAWHPTSGVNIAKLEATQSRATRHILGFKRTALLSPVCKDRSIVVYPQSLSCLIKLILRF